MIRLMLLFILLILLFTLPDALSARETKDIVKDSFEEVSGYGLEIHTNPAGVTVYIDGVKRGITPVFINNPDTGVHYIRLIRDGYEERIFSVNLFSASRLIVSIKMEEIRGLAMVSVYREKESPELLPLNPQIYAKTQDGITTPVIPPHDNKILLSLPVGYNTIKVRAFGWRDSSITVLVNEYFTVPADIFMKPELFKIENISQNRKRFNPMNPGNLGVTEYRFEVSAPGTGAIIIQEENGSVIYEKQFEQFNTWVQNITWDGRDSQGIPYPEGVYTVLIEASALPEFSKEKEKTIFIKMKTEINYSDVIFPLSTDSGISGLTFAPLPKTLPEGSYQIKVNLLLGSFHIQAKTLEDERKFCLPFSIGMRISPINRFELSTVINIIPQLENMTGFGVLGSVKWTCSTTRLVVEQVLQNIGLKPDILLFL
jgi:hypothetical protein